MRDTIRGTSKQVNEIQSEVAERFDSTILHNRMYEAIGQADEVRQLVDVAERASELEEDDRYTRRVQLTALGAAAELTDEIDDVVDAVIAVECAAVIQDARDGWFDEYEDREDIDAAFVEAKAWLSEHGDAAHDAEIDVEDVLYGDGDDDQEVTADV